MRFDDQQPANERKLTLTQLNYALTVIVFLLGVAVVFVLLSKPEKAEKPPAKSENLMDTETSDISQVLPEDEVPTIASQRQMTDYKDWRFTCDQQVTDFTRCILTQQLFWDDGQDALLAKIVLAQRDKSIVPRMTLVAPLDVYLAGGMTLTLEGEDAFTVPFHSCTGGGCLVYLDLAQDVIDALYDHDTLEVRYVGTDGKAQDVSVSLDGFEEAFNALVSSALR